MDTSIDSLKLALQYGLSSNPSEIKEAEAFLTKVSPSYYHYREKHFLNTPCPSFTFPKTLL